MTLEHAAVLKSYSIHITRHRAGIYSGDTRHLPNHNMYTQNKVCHKHVPGTSIHFTHTLGAFYMHVCQGHAARTKSQPTQTIKYSCGNTSQGLVAAVNYCFVHMREAVAGVCIGRVRQGQHQIALLTHSWEPCQAEPRSLTFNKTITLIHHCHNSSD